MFVSNNRASLHLWLKENLVKQQKISKYYETDCLQIFFLHFMFLLAAALLKKSYLGYNLLYFSKNCPKTNLKIF